MFDAPRARTRAESMGEERDLARLLELAAYSVPDARRLLDPGARRELAAFDRSLASALEPYFGVPWAREAALRARVHGAVGELGGQRADLSSLMRSYRAQDEQLRRAARVELDRLLDVVFETTAA